MSNFVCPKKSRWMKKITSSFVALTFSTSLIFGPATGASAQYISNLPKPGEMVLLSPAFEPAVLKGMTLHPENPLQFDFIVDRGQDKLSGDALKGETQKLLKYFLAAMTIPDNDSWVNLSPYEGDRIIPDMLGSTDMGKQMLEQDYLLKQLSASLTNPQEEIGKKFWDTVYKKAYEKFGSTSVPINTFNKVWIVPDRALILEEDGYVFIGESHLKVMLDQDYTSLKENLKSEKLSGKNISPDKAEALSGVSSDVVRQIILPELEKEINEGKNFAAVRQMYHSVILATWYKQNLKNSLLGRIYVDKSKIGGVNIGEKDLKQKVYEQYLAAFRKGVYNLIKEDYDLASKETLPRKYFSGGFDWKQVQLTRAQGTAADSIVLDMKNQLKKGSGRYIVSYARMTEQPQEAAVVTQVAASTGETQRIYYESSGSADDSDPSVLPSSQIPETVTTVSSSAAIIKGWTNPTRFLNLKLKSALQQSGLYDELLAALREKNLKAAEQVVREFNNRFAKKGDQFTHWQAAKPQRIEELTKSDRRDVDYYKQSKLAELEGQQAIIAIAGGLSTRMDPVRLVMDKVGLSSPGIWGINLGALIKKARVMNLSRDSFEVYKRDDTINEKMTQDGWEAYQIIKNLEIETNMQDYTVGDYIMWATIKGVENQFENPQDRNKVRANKTVVVFVNDDIFPQVREGFIKHKGYGFDYKNVIFAKLGFHESYIVDNKGSSLVRSGYTTSANHGASFQEAMLGARGFRLNPDTGKEIPTNGSIVEELRTLGVKAYLARRTNDAMLLLPNGGGYDLDTFAALYAARDKYNARLVAEVMDNPQKAKGGLALTSKQDSPFAEFWEGNETDIPDVSAKIDQLNSNPDQPTYYARLYIAGFLDDTINALESSDGLGLVVKAKSNPLTGRIEISQEIPTGTITRLVPTVPFIRPDFFHSQGVIMQQNTRAIANQQNHDFKDAKSLDQLAEALGFISKTYGMDMAKDIEEFAIASLGKIDDELWHDVYIKKVDTVDARNIANRAGVPLGVVLNVFERLGFVRVYTDVRLKVFAIPPAYQKKLTLVQPKSLDDQYDESVNGANGAVKEAGSAALSASSSVGQARVLVVDTGVPAKISSNKLRAAGYSVVVEPDIQKVQALAREGNFDVIIAGNAQESEPVIRKLINDGNTAKFFIYASPEALLEAGIQELKNNHGVILQAKRGPAEVDALVGATQNIVPANEQKLKLGVPSILRLGDLTTGSDLDFIVRLGSGEEIVVMVEKKTIGGNAAFDITPLFGDLPVGNRSFILNAGRFEKNDNQPEEFAGFIRLGVDGLNVVITSLNGPATVVYSTGQANAAQAKVGSSGIVLVVENEKTWQDSIKLALETKGYTVILANSAEDAQKEIEGMTPEGKSAIGLVISDHNMGEIQGFDFLKSFVSQQLPQAKKILYTMEGSDPKFLSAKKFNIEVLDKSQEGAIPSLMQEVRNQIGLPSASDQVVTTVPKDVGGIDFDPSLLNLQIKRNGHGVPLPLPEQNIENINIDGLYPVIINMQPATIENFPFLTSAENKEKVPQLSMR